MQCDSCIAFHPLVVTGFHRSYDSFQNYTGQWRLRASIWWTWETLIQHISFDKSCRSILFPRWQRKRPDLLSRYLQLPHSRRRFLQRDCRTGIRSSQGVCGSSSEGPGVQLHVNKTGIHSRRRDGVPMRTVKNALRNTGFEGCVDPVLVTTNRENLESVRVNTSGCSKHYQCSTNRSLSFHTFSWFESHGHSIQTLPGFLMTHV